MRATRDSRLAKAVVGVALIDIVAAVVLIVAVARPGNKARPTPQPTVPSATSSASRPAPRPTSRPTSSAPSSSAPTSSTPKTSKPMRTSTTAPPQPSSAKAPVLVAISPPQGLPGQEVTLTGRRLFSANGHISVTFGPALAPVACPSETTCHVQVPAQHLLGNSRTVPVTLKTQSGTSNPVTFTYR